jgi:ankyrin repeat protein
MAQTEPDDDVVEFASKLFALAREGATEQLAAYTEAGVSPNLANHKGDSLVMLAAYHGHAATVVALLARGADPQAGQPSAVATAHMFERADLLALLTP